MEKENKKVDEDYEYTLLTLFNEEGYEFDCSIIYLFDNELKHCSKEEKIESLNNIIHEIEHYRDSL